MDMITMLLGLARTSPPLSYRNFRFRYQKKRNGIRNTRPLSLNIE
jgi:hypothetical protein